MKSLSATVWLLDEKGANVDTTASSGYTALYWAKTLDILTALLGRGANPTPTDADYTPLMAQAIRGHVDNITRLLQDPRVRATIDLQTKGGSTALHYGCYPRKDEALASSIVNLLLQTGANPALTNDRRQMPLDFFRKFCPSHRVTNVLLEQFPAPIPPRH